MTGALHSGGFVVGDAGARSHQHRGQTDRADGPQAAAKHFAVEQPAEHGHVYLDYFSSTVDEKGFLKSAISKDGLHPNAEGYALTAPLAEIEEALKKNP